MYYKEISQEKAILDLLEKHRGKWVGLPKILRLGIAQYNARIHGLRKGGHKIENKTELKRKWLIGKKIKHSYFRLINN